LEQSNPVIWLLPAFAVALSLLLIAAFWKIFTKAGQPGWASIIPVYNAFVLLRIVGLPSWWFWVLCCPLANLYAIVKLSHGLSKSFGKGSGFTFGLIVLSLVFYPILGFGGAPYLGPGGTENDADTTGDLISPTRNKKNENARDDPLSNQRGFNMKNYIHWKLFALGLVCIGAGYIALSIPPAEGFLSLTAAPLLLVCGYVVIVPLSLLINKKPPAADQTP
jgi:hypothetical protein